jgi:hypothetical protein
MNKRILFTSVVALLTASASAFAGESTGRWLNHIEKTAETALPDGRKAIQIYFYQSIAADKADDPLANTAGDAVGRLIYSKEGKLLSGSGMVFFKDASGDGFTRWWKLDEAGTAACPDACGSSGAMDGFGKFKGYTDHGTWVRTNNLPDSASGTYKITYTMK